MSVKLTNFLQKIQVTTSRDTASSSLSLQKSREPVKSNPQSQLVLTADPGALDIIVLSLATGTADWDWEGA